MINLIISISVKTSDDREQNGHEYQELYLENSHSEALQQVLETAFKDIFD